jgi:hypothetical protein
LLKCAKPGGCVRGIPELDTYAQRVFEFFLACHRSDLWVRVGMDAERSHLDRRELAVEARARGVELSEYFLTKLVECEDVVCSFDRERRKRREATLNQDREGRRGRQ